ncbi:cytochrome P450 [Streptomyces sp. NA02950]|uniref:cytochrome P450 n=1 Tax=Streptomyces sp. NA02950 TaxID=2742137 RepID=UPI001592A5BF|nr:cytochrome P450 [Streptomyces sp. NA02950]QKV96730.1 cytochrome P450 [Streptomyces sp. NA02950]
MTDTLTDTSGDTGPEPAYPIDRSPRCPFSPPAGLRELQSTAPLRKVQLWDGSGAWLVTRYEELRALAQDPRISSDILRPGYPHVGVGSLERARRQTLFISMDDPAHARLRRLVTAPFAVKRIQAMRPEIQRLVDELIDTMLAGPCPANLVREFALPLPSLVICRLLGVPYADHAFFQRNSAALLNRNSADQATEAQRVLMDYLDQLVGEKLARPADDLLSALATGQVAAGLLERRELTAIAILLLVAGHETTANMISLGTLALLRHPDQLDALRATDDPARVAAAVEELLRHLTIVQSGLRRVALEDIEIGDRVIRAGEAVILAIDAANHDAAVFSEPDRLDLGRDARHHVAFGYGVHQCLGQQLARVELQVVYSTLYRRVPTLRLAADPTELPYKHDSIVYGVHELPVAW